MKYVKRLEGILLENFVFKKQKNNVNIESK